MSNMTLRNFIISVATLFAVSETGLAQKTDQVILTNGDHITGEIKKLDLDILQFKTSTMSTANIKWHKVSNLYAPDKSFQIELKDKTKLFGNLDSSLSPGVMIVRNQVGIYEIQREKIVTIYQVKQLFWKRFSGSLSAGISYTKASNILQSNGAGDLSYTEDKHYGSLRFDMLQTLQNDTIYVAKKDLSLNLNKMLLANQFVTLFLSGQENTELGIEYRMSAGGGYGVDLLHTNVSRIRFIGAFIQNEEKGLGESSVTKNQEGLVKMDINIFKYTDPEIYVNAFANWYPSITVPGRNRVEAELQIRFELFDDFFLEFKVYNNYDSKPVSTSSSNSDYGLISRLTYTFGL